MVMMRPDGPMEPRQRMTRFQRRGFPRVPPSPGVDAGRVGRPPEATPKLPMPSLPPWMGRPMQAGGGMGAGVIDRQPGPSVPMDAPPQMGGEFAPPQGLPTDRLDQFSGQMPAPEKLPMPALPPGIGDMSRGLGRPSDQLGDKYVGRPRPMGIGGIKRPDETDRQLY